MFYFLVDDYIKINFSKTFTILSAISREIRNTNRIIQSVPFAAALAMKI